MKHGLRNFLCLPAWQRCFFNFPEEVVFEFSKINFLSSALLKRPCNMIGSRIYILFKPVWVSWVIKVVTLFSINPPMPALASVDVAWLTVIVLSEPIGRSSLARCNSNTTWFARVLFVSFRSEEVPIRSIFVEPWALRLSTRSIARIIRSWSGTPDVFKGGDELDCRDLFMLSRKGDRLTFLPGSASAVGREASVRRGRMVNFIHQEGPTVQSKR